MVTTDTLTIGQVAREAGIGVETVRFYERRGLIEEPPRRPSGYRQYPPESVARLRFIRQAKGLGFSLEEIRDLLELSVDASSSCADVEGRLRAKIAELGERIRGLGEMKRALESLAELCRTTPPKDDCPVLDAWAEETRR